MGRAMDETDWQVWRNMVRGELRPLADLLLDSSRPLHPKVRLELANMILKREDTELWIETRLRNGLKFNASRKAKVDRDVKYIDFAIAVIKHGGLRRGYLAQAIFDARKDFPNIDSDETARTHWKKGRKGALLWLSMLSEGDLGTA